MSFVIDFSHHHSQTLLDLVNFCNQDTVYVPLSTDNILVENMAPPTRAGRWSVKLTDKKKPDDYVVVQYTKINLDEFITIPAKHLGWFDLSKGKPSDLSVWSQPAMEAFEATCEDYGMVVAKAWENPSQCHVEYDPTVDRYVLVYECESFVYGPRSRFVLPYNLGQDVVQTQLDGLNYDLAGFWGRKLQELVTIRRMDGFKYRVFP